MRVDQSINGSRVASSDLESLPLTIIEDIVSFLGQDVTSLARLCRTSRIFSYMTQPHLWKHVRLETYGSRANKTAAFANFNLPSPFAAGLNAIVTSNVSRLVRSLSINGKYGSNEYASIRQLPEDVMMLAIAVRAATDQCVNLEAFRWEINIPIPQTLLQGLSKLARLEFLWLRFSTLRSTDTAPELPALPNLKSFTFTHYNPESFRPTMWTEGRLDIMSTLLHSATKLQTLNMHFSPNIHGQTSSVLWDIFQKTAETGRRHQLKVLGIYNLQGDITFGGSVGVLLDPSSIEHLTAISENLAIAVDPHGETYRVLNSIFHSNTKTVQHKLNLKSFRVDRLDLYRVRDLENLYGLEYLYLLDNTPDDVNDNNPRPGIVQGSMLAPTPYSLRDLYLDNICNVCGPTLKHLILPARWPLSTTLAARLIRSCPNLTQLALPLECIDSTQMQTLRLLMPFLSQLWAIRLLEPTQEDTEARRNSFDDWMSQSNCKHEEKIGMALGEPGRDGTNKTDFSRLRYVGFGPKVFEVGPVKEVKVPTPDSDGNTEMRFRYSRQIRSIILEDVKHVEIWKMDSMDIV